MVDLGESFVEQIRSARAARESLKIVGNDTKAALGRRIDARPLRVAGHSGIVDYAPAELVLVARAGTPLADLERALEAHGQMLGFEPPHFGAATIGGTLASNVSGPARPWRGSVRDAVLGVRLVSGRGQHLRFGGNVMKNVAGFDVSRLQAGAFGALGVVTEVSLRVLPQPEREATLVHACDANAAVERMTQLAQRPEPLSGAAWVDGFLHLRVAGSDAAVTGAIRRWGGDTPADAAAFWRALRERELPFFEGSEPLWRLSLKPSLPVRAELGTWLLDWAGAQRYVRSNAGRAALEAEAAGGHVTCLRPGHRDETFASEPGAGVKALQLRLKHAFDPDRVLNPGRFYSWL